MRRPYQFFKHIVVEAYMKNRKLVRVENLRRYGLNFEKDEYFPDLRHTKSLEEDLLKHDPTKSIVT